MRAFIVGAGSDTVKSRSAVISGRLARRDAPLVRVAARPLLRHPMNRLLPTRCALSSPPWRRQRFLRRVLASALFLGALLLATERESAARAQSTAPSESDSLLQLRPPPAMAPDDTASLELRVDVPPDVPLMISATEQGTAVEVVRGRLLRSDAIDPAARPLVFRLPLRARSTGTSVLLVRLDTYACAEGCHPLRREERLTLEVRRRHP